MSQTGTTAETARDRLRHATAAMHDRLHDHEAFSRLMHGGLTLPEYLLLLARLYGFHAALETKMRSVPIQWCYGLESLAHSKAQRLAFDLATLNVSACQIEASPKCTELPAIDSPGAMIGCLYVIEGASLGGRIMAQHLDALLGAGVAAGRGFFAGEPESVPSPWSQCCSAVERCAADGHLEAMVRGAVDTFCALETWLQGGDEDA